MKVTIFFVAVAINFCSAFPTITSFALINDLKDFVDLLPKHRMLMILNEYLETDEEVQNVMAFQNSDDFKKFIDDLESVPEYTRLLRFFQTQGVDVYGYLDAVHELLKMPPYIPPPIYILLKTEQGLKGLIKDWETVLPWNKITTLSKIKMETSEEYKRLYHLMNSPVYKTLFCNCDTSKQFQEIVAFGKQHGFDIYLLNEFTLKIFNIEMVRC